MEENCKNCGAEVQPDDEFCQECGSQIDPNAITCNSCGAKLKKGMKFCTECGQAIIEEINFCENCGNEIEEGEEFCSECGNDLNIPLKSEGSFLEKNRKVLLVGGAMILVVLAIILIPSFMSYNNAPIELPPQTVTVGAEYFEIPGDFYSSPASFDIDTYGGVISFSDSWKNSKDSLSIAVLSSSISVDLESVIASEGGIRKNMMGYDGYYNEIDVNDYSFVFILDGKICVIETTSPHVFDEIKVL
ncbi:double zinc ribbon domain-containing protein [Methanobrevibacter sp.]|uniref:double zinc ribbon domain-containing protein n=1 Tax=Methanobrevibacter sp. TaxID=66852 RepID=UPI00386DF8EE